MLILASASPRRRELLTQAGLLFEIIAPDVDESLPAGVLPGAAVALLAEKKARAAAEQRPDETILAADTVVALDGCIFGKPQTEADAVEMLKKLSGQTHSVFTGFCILKGAHIELGVEETKVEFYPLKEEEINAYVQTGEPMDKAGAYGIQGRGALLVRRVEGDYCNVVGLPLARVARALALL